MDADQFIESNGTIESRDNSQGEPIGIDVPAAVGGVSYCTALGYQI